MVVKSNPQITTAFIVYLVFFTFGPFIFSAQSQIRKQDERTILQLGSGFVAVVSSAQILLDSGLIISAKANHLSRISVITEGMDDPYSLVHCQWMDNNLVDSAKKKLSMVKNPERVRQLLLLGAYYAFKPGSKNNYEEAIRLLKIAKKEAEELHLSRWAIQSSCLIGKSYFMLENISTGQAWFSEALKGARFLKYRDLEAKAWNYQGIYCPFRDETNQFRINCLKQALTLYERLHDTGNQINTLMDLAYISFANQQVDSSEFYAKQSLALQVSENFSYQHYSYDLLSFLSDITRRYYLGLTYAYAELESAKKTKDNLALTHAYYRIGLAKAHTDNANELIDWLVKASNTPQFFENPDFYSMLTSLITYNVEITKGDDLLQLIKKTIKAYPPKNVTDWTCVYLSIGSCYEVLKKYNLAFIYYSKAEKVNHGILQKKRGNMLEPYLIYKLGYAHFLRKDYRKSRIYFKRYESKYFEKTRYDINLLDVYFKLYQIDSIYNNPSARNYLLKYANLKDKIYNEAESRQMADMNVKYETQLKEKNILALKNQNILQVQQQANTKKLFYMGFTALAIITAVVYSRYRHKQKSNTLLKMQRDEINNQNLALQTMNDKQTSLLIEKDWLLKEVHHRVKNNLQIVTSLLTSQSVFLKDQAALSAITDSQNRIEAMSLIHQKLYNSENMSTISMPDYITDLVVYLKDSYRVKGLVRVDYQIDKIKLDVAKAIPLGLILNEAITNVFKYAFPFSNEDTVSIQLSSLENKSITLVVADNGRGFPENFDFNATKTFGMILMKGMAEELDGTFDIANQNGTRLSLTFSNIAIINS